MKRKEDRRGKNASLLNLA